MRKFVWAPNARIAGDPQLCGAVLLRLQRQHGRQLVPRVVVDEARRPESPLHRAFEWDNEKAGELYRLDQARSVIRSIRVITEQPQPGDEPRMERVFVNVVSATSSGDEQAYVTLERLRSEPELFEVARQQALRDLMAFERRYQEFSAIVAPIAEAREQLELLAAEQAVPA